MVPGFALGGSFDKYGELYGAGDVVGSRLTTRVDGRWVTAFPRPFHYRSLTFHCLSSTFPLPRLDLSTASR